MRHLGPYTQPQSCQLIVTKLMGCAGIFFCAIYTIWLLRNDAIFNGTCPTHSRVGVPSKMGFISPPLIRLRCDLTTICSVLLYTHFFGRSISFVNPQLAFIFSTVFIVIRWFCFSCIFGVSCFLLSSKSISLLPSSKKRKKEKKSNHKELLCYIDLVFHCNSTIIIIKILSKLCWS